MTRTSWVAQIRQGANHVVGCDSCRSLALLSEFKFMYLIDFILWR
jgi:hypothetical protein